MTSPLFTQVLLSALALFLLTVSVFGFALGIALILRSRAVVPFIALMNRWVSTRQALRPLEVPRRAFPAAARGRWLGVPLIVLGAYAAATLIGSVETARVAALFNVDPRTSVAGIGLDAARWLLVAGSLAAVATGALLAFFPSAWRLLEARANRWHSTRELEARGDAMHLSLDRLVTAFPRTSGTVISFLSLVAAAAAGTRLL